MATKIVTGKLRLSYAHLFTPESDQNGGEPVYSVKLLIPKSDKATYQKLMEAIREAREAFCAKNGANALPPKPAHTIHDGDQMKDDGSERAPEEKGCWVMNVKSKYKPVIVDINKQEILDPAEVYSGCYARVCINAYGYSRSGKRGVSFRLMSVQKLADGEPLGGTMGSANDFDDEYDDLMG